MTASAIRSRPESLEQALPRMRGQRVYLDTNAFIYLLEGLPRLAEQVAALLDASAAHTLVACTGEATWAELLIKPLRDRDAVAVQAIDRLLGSTGMVHVLAHDRAVFRRATELRALRRLRFIDALHLATAVEGGCRFFVTNDRDFKAIEGIERVVLA